MEELERENAWLRERIQFLEHTLMCNKESTDLLRDEVLRLRRINDDVLRDCATIQTSVPSHLSVERIRREHRMIMSPPSAPQNSDNNNNHNNNSGVMASRSLHTPCAEGPQPPRSLPCVIL
eukprot:PhF_6_TR43387/c0_g1_i3/m.66593